MAALLVGCRAIPVPVAALSNLAISRSPTLREATCLRLWVRPLHAVAQTALVRGDRGCRRVR